MSGYGQQAAGNANAAAAEVIPLMRRCGLSIATAESLTGGLLCAALTDVPGSSSVVRGAVVAYATELKAALLGVPAELLERRGPVDADVALAMADGVRARLAADVGVATTGVAGPDPQGEAPVGRVFVALVAAAGGADQRTVRRLQLAGDRQHVRVATVAAALGLIREACAQLRG